MWFNYDLQESKYQLKIQQACLFTEKQVNGMHIAFFEERIRRLESDIKELIKKEQS